MATGPVKGGLNVMKMQAKEPKTARPSAARIHANPWFEIALYRSSTYIIDFRLRPKNLARRKELTPDLQKIGFAY